MLNTARAVQGWQSSACRAALLEDGAFTAAHPSLLFAYNTWAAPDALPIGVQLLMSDEGKELLEKCAQMMHCLDRESRLCPWAEAGEGGGGGRASSSSVLQQLVHLLLPDFPDVDHGALSACAQDETIWVELTGCVPALHRVICHLHAGWSAVGCLSLASQRLGSVTIYQAWQSHIDAVSHDRQSPGASRQSLIGPHRKQGLPASWKLHHRVGICYQQCNADDTAGINISKVFPSLQPIKLSTSGATMAATSSCFYSHLARSLRMYTIAEGSTV